MTLREFTVKMRPEEGVSRVQLAVLAPHDFPMYGAAGAGSIVEVKVTRVVGRHVFAQFQTGDMPEGGLVLREQRSGPDGFEPAMRGSVTMKVEARRYWNIVAAFYADYVFGQALVQTADTDYHIVVHATSRAA